MLFASSVVCSCSELVWTWEKEEKVGSGGNGLKRERGREELDGLEMRV